MPHMQDPFFGKSVVFICEHTKDGAMGLIVNHPFKKKETKALFTNFYEKNIFKTISTLYFGGPVLIETGIVLHSSEYKKKETIQISDDFSLTGHKYIQKDFNTKKCPEFYKLILGHAGWTRGQLEGEIEHGDWFLQPTTKDFIFNTPDELMWNRATKEIGIQTTQITGAGGIA